LDIIKNMSAINWVMILILLFQNGMQPSADREFSNPKCQVPSGFIVRFHPDDVLRAGDLISIEIFANASFDLKSARVAVRYNLNEIGTANFSDSGEGGFRAVLLWSWDTNGLAPGKYDLTFMVLPSGPVWNQTVDLMDPFPSGNQYTWKTLKLDCCDVHYISHTPAEKDLDFLSRVIREKAVQAASALHTPFSTRLQINIIPRFLGHGGFTSDEIYVSYGDHNITGADFSQILEHEMIHALDTNLEAKYRPIILVEGLAVFLSGGHYQPEPLLLKAATLLHSGIYIPLTYLSDNFYLSQHEIGYQEAGALVAFLVQNYGWDRFSNFYRDIQAPVQGNPSQAIDDALKHHFNLAFSQIENQFLTFLENQPLIPDLETGNIQTIDFYDTLREYQQQLDPSAYYRQLWTPEIKKMRVRNIVGDYLRNPDSPANIKVEKMLKLASLQLLSSRNGESRQTVWQIQRFLRGSRPLPCGITAGISTIRTRNDLAIADS
jgi:hypothetical protein